MSASDDFKIQIFKAMRAHSEGLSEKNNENSDTLSSKEVEDYEQQEDSSAESIAEIKQAQALLDEKQSKLKRKLLKGQVTLQKQDISMRREYASKAYRFVWLWSIALIVILVLDGSKSPTVNILFFRFDAHEFSLEPSVLIALISGVTVNIVAVFVVVIRNLFPNTKPIKDDEYKKDAEEAKID
ncbi:hypothetical protein WFP00_03360 [Yersinia enterocolitica]